MKRHRHYYSLIALVSLTLTSFLLVPQVFAQSPVKSIRPLKAKPSEPGSKAVDGAQSAIYLREKLRTIYSVACTDLESGDQTGRSVQKAARIALASYAENLARIRYEQLDAARKLSDKEMDADEKQDRLSALHRQLALLEALQRVKYAESACPPLFDQEVLFEQARSSPSNADLPAESPARVATALAAGPAAASHSVQQENQKSATPTTVSEGKKAILLLTAMQAPAAKPDDTKTTACTSDEGVTLRLTPQKLVFGSQPWATESAPKTVTIHNACSTQVAIHLPDPPSSDFRVNPKDCGTVLEKDHDCQFEVVYAPFSTRKEPVTLFVPNLPLIPRVTKVADLQERIDKVALAEAKVQELNAQAESEKGKTEKTAKGQTEKTALFTDITDQLIPGAMEELSRAREKLNAGAPYIKLEGTPEHWKYPLTRAVAGLDLSAVSSRTVKQSYFVEFNLTAPLQLTDWRASHKNEDPLEDRFWVWFNPKITSLPSATQFSALSTINESASFLDTLKSSSSNTSLVQGLDMSGGLEVAWLKPRNGIPWWAEYPNTRARLGASIVAGFGVSTPFSTSSEDVTSTVNQSICDAFKAPDPTKPNTPSGFITCGFKAGETSPRIFNPVDTPGTFTNGFTNVTFFTPNRSRFFRRYMFGLRLKSFYFNKDVKADCYLVPDRDERRGDCEAPYDIFPGTIDLTLGKDEAVTAGHLKSWLFRIDAVYPLPFYQGFHAFGSVYTALTRNRVDAPFSPFATNTPTTGANNDANTFRLGLMPLNRDYFRVGVGVDLIQLFKKKDAGGQPNPKQPTPPTTDNKTGTAAVKDASNQKP